MKYIGTPMGMWVLFGKSFEGHLVTDFGLNRDTAKSMCRLDYTISEAGGASDFVREYTIASEGAYCDCGYKKKRK